MKARTSELYDRQQAVEFYDDRYEQGYLDDWPVEKKQQIVEILRDLKLPPVGTALDFGCGNGVLTELVREVLPQWTVFGTDISRSAVANARKRYPKCTFFAAEDPELSGKTFDFVFSNHVFEHVFDLNSVFHQMCGFLKPQAAMLHLLPCGNPGSYEHSICLLRKDGIAPHLENRFFFEDEGHVRRLTTDQFAELAKVEGFELKREFYSHHHLGAIDWITDSHPKLVIALTDSSLAVDAPARRKLRAMRIFLLFLTILRLPSQILAKTRDPRYRGWKKAVLRLAALPFSLVSAPLDRYLKRKAAEEWKTRRASRGGSDMALYFTRG